MLKFAMFHVTHLGLQPLAPAVVDDLDDLHVAGQHLGHHLKNGSAHSQKPVQSAQFTQPDQSHIYSVFSGIYA